jgi:hypothetical protein
MLRRADPFLAETLHNRAPLWIIKKWKILMASVVLQQIPDPLIVNLHGRHPEKELMVSPLNGSKYIVACLHSQRPPLLLCDNFKMLRLQMLNNNRCWNA